MSNVGSVCGPSSQAVAQAQKTPETQRGGAHSFYKRLDNAAAAAGLDASKVSQLHADIKAAVESALKSGDDHGAIKEAVTGVLKQYGIDPASLKPGGHGHFRHQNTGSVSAVSDPNAPAASPPSSDDQAAAALNGLPAGTLVDAAA